MTSDPSLQQPVGVRGSLLVQARDGVRRLEDQGKISRDELLASLSPDDLSYLYADVAADCWYPIEIHDRLSRVGCDKAGEGDEYLVEGGRALARSLLDRPIVREVDATSSDREQGEAWWQPAGHLLVVLPSSLITHTTWVLYPEDDPGRFRIEVTRAESLPETSRLALQGALESLARILTDRNVSVTSERSAPGRIEFEGRVDAT